MTAIGLLSDVHATAAPVALALEIFHRAGVEQVWCAGDIAGPNHPESKTKAFHIRRSRWERPQANGRCARVSFPCDETP